MHSILICGAKNGYDIEKEAFFHFQPKYFLMDDELPSKFWKKFFAQAIYCSRVRFSWQGLLPHLRFFSMLYLIQVKLLW